jgi:Domain of unknown function (DUF4279)
MEIKGHRYTVELRVFGETLDPESITRETGLQPCQVRLVGDRIGTRTYTKAMWAFDGGGRDWDFLEDGLAFVLDRLGTSEKLFAKYGVEHHLIWWCGHFQSRFDGGPTLSAPLLARLGSFGAELFIDNYFSRDKEDE